MHIAWKTYFPAGAVHSTALRLGSVLDIPSQRVIPTFLAVLSVRVGVRLPRTFFHALPRRPILASRTEPVFNRMDV